MNHGTAILNLGFLGIDLLALLDDTVSIGSEMDHHFVSEQRSDLLDGDLFCFRDEEVHHNGGDDAQSHIQEVHVVFTVVCQ